jgi:hypothetical protein
VAVVVILNFIIQALPSFCGEESRAKQTVQTIQDDFLENLANRAQ